MSCVEEFIKDGNVTYRLVAKATLIHEPEGNDEAGKWESRVTVYRKSEDDPPHARRGTMQIGSTSEEANEKALTEGRRIVHDATGL